MTDKSPSLESPVQCALDRVDAAKAEIAKAEKGLAQAKVDLLNEKLREIEALRCDLECPETVLVITRGGPVYARVDPRAGMLSQFSDLLIIDPRTPD
ncbi:hypothetical protein CFR75_06220 [Komagataeibacter xylinus]|uniref:Uncharacterized protein n=1 Tax=Komagataeibacter xylinus TaxID=28448 RepID=A0A318PP55_KOMXY|nr:hypothetical protein [Komagataeibacter xylinus]PYD57410.1 hypothetical protein CFR75_06220 [Komagataeibacter xylinus]GBQ80758.1 hypothetical protein AA15237_3064 [Komagataeibacter xylinus NBRC 15237]